jgi:hypothetical protein
MKATILGSLFISLLIVELVTADFIPSWVRKQMRRRRGRNNALVGCDYYINKRCAFGLCFMRPDGYPDQPANFTNAQYNVGFACVCKAGYETYYPENQDSLRDTYTPTAIATNPPIETINLAPQDLDFCNAEQNPCREENDEDRDICQTKSMDNRCTHTGPGQSECHCNIFWTGDLCNQDVDECAPCYEGDGRNCPCQNNGRCQNEEQSDENPLGFKCLCKTGTTGDYCQTVTNPCSRDPCKQETQYGGAIDQNPCTEITDIQLSDPKTLQGYECKCKDDWGGPNCEMRRGSCLNGDPCGDRGACDSNSLYPGYYQCLCNPGRENDVAGLAAEPELYCNKTIDLCVNNPCRNNGTCLMLGVNNKFCVCTPGYTGPNCESSLNPCYESQDVPKCLNGGKCSPKGNSLTEYECECENTGYEKEVCGLNVVDCGFTSSPDGGNCYDTIGNYTYLCNNGYEGKNCTGITSSCSPDANICQYGGSCQATDDFNKNFRCDCDTPNGLKFNNQTIMTGRDCNTLRISADVKRHDFNLTDGVITPTRSSVYRTRDGGIYNNSFLRFDSGALEQTLKEPFPADSWTMLFFQTQGPSPGNLVTFWDNLTSEPLFEIVAMNGGINYALKYHKTVPPITIEFPRHSLNDWNQILWVKENTTREISAYLNTLLVAKLSFNELPGYDMSDVRVMFGSSPQPDSPRFSGGIGNLFYGSTSSGWWQGIKENLLYAHAPNCQQAQILPFAQPDLYRDTGCFRLNALAVGEQVFSTYANISTPEGTPGGSLYFPLISFRPLENSVDDFQTVSDETQVLVPHFPFNATGEQSDIGLVFRFRPTAAARVNGRYTFAQSRLLDGPSNAFALQAGTSWTEDDEFRFFLALPIGNTGEMQTMEAILYANSTVGGPEFEFCKDCVWTVVVQWKMRTESDSAPLSDNLIMHHIFRGETRKTTHTTQSQISRANSSPLEIGVDKKHQIGRFQVFFDAAKFGATIPDLITKGETPPTASQ